MKLSDFCRPVALAACVWTASAGTASAAVEPYLGQIMYTAASYCPNGWLDARGQIVAIASNSALYALLSTTYGGNGTTTFALPNLSSRVVVGTGFQVAGLTPRILGATGGNESVTLSPQTMSRTAVTVPVTVATINEVTDGSGEAKNVLVPAGTPNATQSLITGAIANGGNTPISIVPPFVALTACIATTGVFPSRP